MLFFGLSPFCLSLLGVYTFFGDIDQVSEYSELSNKRTAGNNRTADPKVMKLIIGPQVLIGPQD